ncbi:MAG TPA: hypothetical protein VHI74_06155 [Methyloceanibacter sp.]|jgi:hypothetical protein|nr:hypothetical protein [Methyloceanibacter sp.]
MTSAVIDVHQCGAAVQRAHGFDGKIVRLTAVIGYLPLSARLDRNASRAVRRWTNAHTVHVEGKVTTAPMTLVRNKSASLLDDLELE